MLPLISDRLGAHSGVMWRQANKLIVKHFNLLVAIVVTIRLAWVFSVPLRSSDGLLKFAEDDFYYYLKIAQNFAQNHQSAAFEHVWTNGFHPLYFLLLSGLSVFVRGLPGVYRFLWLLDTASATAVFLLTRRIFACLTGMLLANALALTMAYLCIPMICCQMEVTLALPLGFAFLLAGFVDPAAITPRRAAVMGLLASLTLLARLDAALIVGLYLAAFLALRESRTALTRKVATSFVFTALPLPVLYVWCNKHYFGTLLPISGMAKELRSSRVPSLLLFQSFSGSTNRLLIAAALGIITAGLLRQRLALREKVFLVAALLDPFIFYGTETLISDWPVWPWYFYALRFSAAGVAVCCIVVSRSVSTIRYKHLQYFKQTQLLAVLFLVVITVKLTLVGYSINRWMVEIQHAAGVLDQFAETHRGVYAMGDRAGMFLISTPSPVLQAEGLVMDRDYLDHMRAQDDLRSVLSQYGVDYYVSFVPKRSWDTQFQHGCFHAVEPFLAGPSAKHMRSDFCRAPTFQFPGFDGVYVVYPIPPAQPKS